MEKQKKGNLYVYKFGPIMAAGGQTPDHNSTGKSVTKRIIPSSVWGLRKSKAKPKPEPESEPKPCQTENVDCVKNIRGVKGRETDRKSTSIVEGILMSLANSNESKLERGRKSISTIEDEKVKIIEKESTFSSEQDKVKGEGGRKSVSHVENHVAYVGRFVEKPRKSISEVKLESNVISAIALLQVKVLVTDMPGFMQLHAFQCARKTYDSLEKFSAKHLAHNLKKEFDKLYGPAWHCIVGSSFGSFVTHSTGCFLYFSMEKLCILLFRTKLQKSTTILQQ